MLSNTSQAFCSDECHNEVLSLFRFLIFTLQILLHAISFLPFPHSPHSLFWITHGTMLSPVHFPEKSLNFTQKKDNNQSLPVRHKADNGYCPVFIYKSCLVTQELHYRNSLLSFRNLIQMIDILFTWVIISEPLFYHKTIL